MKKTFTAFMLSLLCAGALSASAYETLYVTGDNVVGAPAQWSPDNPLEVQLNSNNQFVFRAFGNFKISTQKGSWDDFNAKAKKMESWNIGTDSATADLVVGSDMGSYGDCWNPLGKTDYKNADVVYIVDKEFTKIEASVQYYLIGNLAAGAWEAAQVPMTKQEDGSWTLTHEIKAADLGYGWFSFVTRSGNKWDYLNGSHRYGSNAYSSPINVGNSHDVIVYSGNNADSTKPWKIPAGNYYFELKPQELKLTVHQAAVKPVVSLPDGYSVSNVINLSDNDGYKNEATSNYFPVEVTIREGETLHYSTTCYSTKLGDKVIEETTPKTDTPATSGMPLDEAVPGSVTGATTYYFYIPSGGEISFYTTKGTDTNKSDAVSLSFTGAAAGVEDIVADGENGAVEYFNMQGMRVVNPVAGSLLIKRQGNTVTKVLVK